MRIIAGKHKGRAIESGKLPGLRPTSSFSRAAIFNILSSHGDYAELLVGGRVLDACCGTGALGLEALSRGAAYVLFIDNNPQSLQLARASTERYGEREHTGFLRADITGLPHNKSEPFDLVFLDPPYFGKLLAPALHSLVGGKWIDIHSVLVIEYDAREEIIIPSAFTTLDKRKYGRTIIRLLRIG